MGEAYLDYKKGGTGGLDINGIIQDYYVYAGTNVNAGDFVEFVNGIGGLAPTLVSTSPVQLHSRNTVDIKSILLDENKVFIIAQDDSTNYGYAKIATISDGTITLGTDYQISSSAMSSISIAKVTESKVAISFVTSYKASAIIASISDTTITFGSVVTLGEGTSSYPDASTSIAALTKNYLVIAWNRNDTGNNNTNTTRGLRACVLYTSGTTALSSYTMFKFPRNGTNQYLSLCAVNSTTATLAYKAGNSSGSTVYMFVLQRSSGTLTAGDDTQVSSAVNPRQICSCLINTDTVLIVHGVAASSSSYSAYGRTAYISGTTVTLGSREALNTGKYVEFTGVNLLETNKAVISYYNSNTKTGIMVIATMSGTNSRSITFSENYVFAENTIITTTTPCVLNPNTVLVTYGTNLQVNTKGQLFSIDGTSITNEIEVLAPAYETQVRPATSLPCKGVASTSGEGGTNTGHKDIVSIYTQSMNNLITNGDFNDNIDGWSVGTTTHCDIAHENGALKGIGLALGNGYVNIAIQHFTAIQNHIYYCSCDVINHSITGEAYFYISEGVSNKVSTNADWYKISYRGTLATYGYESYQGIISLRWSALTEGDISYWDNIVLYDLTALYGAGNEPTQEWCDANL